MFTSRTAILPRSRPTSNTDSQPLVCDRQERLRTDIRQMLMCWQISNHPKRKHLKFAPLADFRQPNFGLHYLHLILEWKATVSSLSGAALQLRSGDLLLRPHLEQIDDSVRCHGGGINQLPLILASTLDACHALLALIGCIASWGS